ncbi:TetR/AcrR family transcriptional regulator [Mycobacterium sp. E183]|uniref:TetR/AcrR family transcriptional regulator n=2 Tax=unclassified Mycobacterium TaxID=2642494 RepID=UPI00080068E7|nr:TetR/AcrR family transcriptional regulator [Mycobacterium sp. E183]OBH41766.1 TetR family transcriptional regulator [Mycobacterium sp. E183]
MSARPSRLGRPVGADGEQTRTRIITAAMRTVAEMGYSRTTIREIARAADMTSGSLYHYFPNKSELLGAAVEDIERIAAPRLRDAAAQADDVVERLVAVLEEASRMMREYPDLAAFEWVIRAEGVVGPDRHMDGGTGFQAFREIIEGVVDDGYRQGELSRPSDRDSVVEALYALIYGLVELGATSPPRDYHAALDSAKKMISGTLFAGGRG